MAASTRRTADDTDNPWLYWVFSPPDAKSVTKIEWLQGDEDGPFDGLPRFGTAEELRGLERDGWVTVGVWWRPLK